MNNRTRRRKIKRRVIKNRILSSLVLMMAIILTIIVRMVCQKEDSTQAQVADIVSTAGIAKFLSKEDASLKSRQHLLLKQVEEAETTTENSVEMEAESTTEEQTIKVEGETETTGEQPEISYKTIAEIRISKEMYLGETLGISKESFIQLISDYRYDNEDKRQFYARNAGYIWDVCQRFQINELFFCAVIAWESGWGTDSDCVSKHNYTGYKPGGIKKVFGTPEECFWESARNLTNYTLPEGKFYDTDHPRPGTLGAIGPIYCTTNSQWPDDIYGIMEQFLRGE